MPTFYQPTWYSTGNGITAAATTASSNIWMAWNTVTANTVTGGTGNGIWTLWNAPQAPQAASSLFIPPRAAPTPAELQRQNEAAAQYAREQRERTARIEAANDKAQKLLIEVLSDKQREQLAANGWFDVEVGGATYRIKRGFAGNVRKLDGAREVEQYCIHPRERVPDCDAMIAQKLLLEANPEEFFRTANRTRLV